MIGMSWALNYSTRGDPGPWAEQFSILVPRAALRADTAATWHTPALTSRVRVTCSLGSYPKGLPISGIAQASLLPGVTVYARPPAPRGALPCDIRREEGHSLVILEGRRGIPLYY